MIHDMDSVQKQLEELGLGQNEVKAYLAALELGSATVLQIAAKAAMVRPTAHVAVGGLVKRGLMSSHTRGKKQYFQAERPGQLMRMVDEEKKKLADRESKLKSLLPGLEALMSMSGEKPEVSYYEGLEGLEAIRTIIYESKARYVNVIACYEHVRENLPEENSVIHNYKLKKRNIPGRQINIIDNPKKHQIFSKNVIEQENWQVKNIYRSGFKFQGEIGVFNDYIGLVVHSQKPLGIVIKSRDLAATLEILFEIAWNSGQLKLDK